MGDDDEVMHLRDGMKGVDLQSDSPAHSSLVLQTNKEKLNIKLNLRIDSG